MSGPIRKLPQKMKLGAAIAFAEGMHVVKIAHDLTGAHGEISPCSAAKMVGRDQPAVNVGHTGFDETAKLELVATLGDLDHADLARPVIHVLE